MCTLTITGNAESWCITFNRDESIARAKALKPAVYFHQNVKMIYPKDAAGLGTWFATNKEKTVCLLNGGLKKHIRKEKYRHSRGIVVLEAMVREDFNVFAHHFPIEDIEPFTLRCVNHHPFLVYEFIWTGEEKYFQEIHSLPIMKCSYTLYPLEIQNTRKEWLQQYYKKPEVQSLSLEEVAWKFHHEAGEGDKENDLIMKRTNGVETLSIIQLKGPNPNALKYHDLITQELFTIPI